MSDDVKEQLNEALRLHQNGNILEAERLYTEILKKNPNEGNVLNLLGTLKNDNNQPLEAVFYLKKAVQLYPNFFDAYFNLGLAYKNINEFDKALDTYEKALKLKPNDSSVYFNIANIYESKKNDTFKAIEYYEKAYEYNTDEKDSDIHYFLGICYLKAKNFEKGLIHHEYRPSKKFATFSQSREYQLINERPYWNGEEMKGKNLFVYYESALGDTLMYVRYLKLLESKFAKIFFKPQRCFYSFFKENNFNVDLVGTLTLAQDVKFDVHIPLMSIPYVLNLNTEEIPFAEGYLKANPEKILEYKEKYFNNDKFKIGIKWKGNTAYELSRIITFNSFFKIFDLPNTQFYSVQKGEGIEDLENIPPNYNVVNLGETFNDFNDTAAAIENCDLIICNDTSIAHLAGAMGKPCWILLPWIQNWRWHTDISYSPWYKSVKLFKQTEAGNWDEVFDRVKAELEKIINK